MGSHCRVAGTMAAAIAAMLMVVGPASAESLSEALAAAYSDNPTLNAQRASLRATDEGVPQALSGYRPTVTANASAGIQNTNQTGTFYPRMISLTVTAADLPRLPHDQLGQDGGDRCARRPRSTAQHRADDPPRRCHGLYGRDPRPGASQHPRPEHRFPQRAGPRRQRPAECRRGNPNRRRPDRRRSSVGSLDLQRRRRCRSTPPAPHTNWSSATPRKTSASCARSTSCCRGRSISGIATGRARHPAILASGYNVDVAAFNVKVLEGQLLPTVSVDGTVSSGTDQQGPGTGTTNSAAIMARLTRADLSGWPAVGAGPAGQGNAWPAAHRAGCRPRPGTPRRRLGLGQSRRRPRPDRGDQRPRSPPNSSCFPGSSRSARSASGRRWTC